MNDNQMPHPSQQAQGPAGAVAMAERQRVYQEAYTKAPRTPVDIVRAMDAAGIIHLADGGAINIRVAMISAKRVEGMLDQDGNPVYETQLQTIQTYSGQPKPT